MVLNLVINGLPSILRKVTYKFCPVCSFKPCYKWITFNTEVRYVGVMDENFVLNLVINGLPSILLLTQ